MSIKGISENIAPESFRGVDGVTSLKGKTQAHAAQAKDYVDMSRLSKLMARSLNDLESQMSPRPEVIRQHKGQINSAVDLSDSVIDTIFQGMARVD